MLSLLVLWTWATLLSSQLAEARYPGRPYAKDFKKRARADVSSVSASVSAVPTSGSLPPSQPSPGAPTVTIDSGVVIGIQTTIPVAWTSKTNCSSVNGTSYNSTSSASPSSNNGTTNGTTCSSNSTTRYVNKFLGVPFAAPPVRFSPSVKPDNWTTPFNATQPGPACIQQFVYPKVQHDFEIAAFNTPAPQESEDCLNVNVWAPAPTNSSSSNSTLKAVMFWLYGGALQFGYNSNPVFDGTNFAAYQDIIVVTPNYRTNVFGFPDSPQLNLTQRNLGFLDQRLALDWVQRNIKAFGGDPNNVTIAGQSAGAASVDELVTTYGNTSHAPFRAAIMQSGQASFYVNPTNTNASWATLVKNLNCTGPDYLSCAREANASTIKNITEMLSLSFKPVADNYTALRFPELARKSGNISHVPIMTGTNANDGSIFTLTLSNTSMFLQGLFPNNTQLQQQLLAAYPYGSDGIFNDQTQLSAIFTDFIFQCPAAFLQNASAKAGISSWNYYYNATFPNIQPIPGLDLDVGAWHGSEIPIIFGTYNLYGRNAGNWTNGTSTNYTSILTNSTLTGGYNTTSNSTGNGTTADWYWNEVALSRGMMKMWGDFVKNPTRGPATQWGWSQFPHVEVIGGPNGKDAASGKFLANSTSDIIDKRCYLYQSMYDILEG